MAMTLRIFIVRGMGLCIFFSLLVALCPIEAGAAARARTRSARPEKQAAQQREDIPKRDEAAAAPVEGVKEPTAPAAPGDKGAPAADNGMGLYNNYQAEASEPESYGWLIFKTILVIGLLVGGFYYFFRYVTRKAGIQVLGKDVVQVLSVVPLGQNKYLQVVDLAGRVLVLGVTDNNINLIAEISERDEMDRIRVLSSRAAMPEAEGFQDFLAKQIGRFFRKNEAPEKPGVGAERIGGEMDRLAYLKRQRDRLKRINGNDDEA